MKVLIIILVFISSNYIFSNEFELKYSSFSGGNARDFGETVIVDEYDNIYVLGHTESSNFPVTDGAYQTIYKGGGDLYLMKYDSDYNLIWSTLIGGSAQEFPKNLKIHNNTLYVVSDTKSGNFPITMDAFQKNIKGDYDGTIMQFSTDGKLLYSTFIGSSSYDVSDDIVIDEDGNYWVTGRCHGSNFPITNDAVQKNKKNGVDSFISKFDKDNNLVYSTYIGGNSDDFAMDLALNSFSKTIAVIGYTRSNDFPIIGKAIKNKHSSSFDSFICYYNYDGELIWSSYFGGEGQDYGEHIVTDNEDGFYFRMFTNSNKLMPSYNTFQKENPGMMSSYVGRVNYEGEFDWGTYYGSTSGDGDNSTINKGGDISVDEKSNVLITGYTLGSDLITTEKPYQADNKGASDAYITVFDKFGDNKISSYFGGSLIEDGRGVYLSNNLLVLTGASSSPDFPVTEDAFQKQSRGGKDGFISIFALEKSPCESQYSSSNGFLEQDLISNKLLGNSSVNLTRKWAYDAGYMYYHNKLNLISGFQTEFSFVISDPSRYFTNPEDKAPQVLGDTSLAGADGIALVLAGEIPIIPALAGGDIGYGGLTNAIAIEIDLYENPENRDPNGNHVSVILPNEDNQIFPLHPKKDTMTTTDVIEIKSDSSQTYHCKVVYENLTLKIYLSDSKEYGKPVLEIKDFILFDYLNMEYNGNGFLGITSSTGRSVEVHEITEWSICTSRNLILTSVDEVESNEIEFYPSPVSEYMTINLPANLNNGFTIKVYDLLGNLQMQNNISSYKESISLDANTLAKGAYSVVIESDGNIVGSSKFIKK